MRFMVNVVSAGDFDKWIAQARGSGSSLDAAGYAALLKPSKAVPPATFGSVERNLFERIVNETAAGFDNGAAGAAWCPPALQAGG